MCVTSSKRNERSHWPAHSLCKLTFSPKLPCHDPSVRNEKMAKYQKATEGPWPSLAIGSYRRHFTDTRGVPRPPPTPAAPRAPSRSPELRSLAPSGVMAREGPWHVHAASLE